MKQLLENLTSENAFMCWLFLILSILAGAALTGLTADHSIKGYYLMNECIKVEYDWGIDNSAFCSDDIDKTLRVLKQLQGK